MNVERNSKILNRFKSPANIAKGAVLSLKVPVAFGKYCKTVGKDVGVAVVGACGVILTVKPKPRKALTKIVALTVKK